MASYTNLTLTNGEIVLTAWWDVLAVLTDIDDPNVCEVYTANQTRNANPWKVAASAASAVSALSSSSGLTIVADAPFASATLTNGRTFYTAARHVADIRVNDATTCYAYVEGIQEPFHVDEDIATFRTALFTSDPYADGSTEMLLAIVEVTGSDGSVGLVHSAPGYTIGVTPAVYTPGSAVYDFTITGLPSLSDFRVAEQVRASAGVCVPTRCNGTGVGTFGVTYVDAAGAAEEPTSFLVFIYRTNF